MTRVLLFALLCTMTFTAVDLTAEEDIVMRKTAPQKLLVLNSGQVFGGQLMARTDGYDVILPSGRLYVSSDRIRFIASSMQDAYEKMSASVQHKTPAVHVQMARWCLTNGLHSQARRELLDAMHLDPDHGLARSMLESLARQERAASAKLKTTPDVVSIMAAHQVGIIDRRSLGGLPIDTARTFTVRIQSLLSKNCGNAKCHGGNDNSFAFTNIRGASSVIIAEQNLAAVLKQISLTDPERSPLLIKAQTLHGGARSPSFSGRVGSAQLQSLRDWVNEVSTELVPSHTASSQQTAAVNTRSIPSHSQKTAPVGYQTESTTQTPVDGVTIQQRQKSETDGEFGRAALEAVRNDPFDPMIFNRRYHGETRSSR